MPLVSVIVPMYNAEAFISATLASILHEREITLEIVVVNDRSTDASLERVQAIDDKRVRIVNGSFRGVAAAMNAGIAIASGEIVMRCDADDLYPPQRIAQQVDWLVKHPGFGAVCGSFAPIDVKGHPIANFNVGKDAEEITEELRSGITRTHYCTFAVRTEVLRSLAGYRPYFIVGEDIDLQLRIGEFCRVWYLPDIQYYWRLHDNSLTHTQSNVELEFYEFQAREFQRQRLTQGSDDLQRGCPLLRPPRSSDNSVTSATAHAQGILIGSAWQKHQAGHKLRSLAIGIRSVIARPSNIATWRSLLALAVKSAGK